MNCAFINSDNIVVQVVSGHLSADSQMRFLIDYNKLFGADRAVNVREDQVAGMGYTYENGEFIPPAPQLEITE